MKPLLRQELALLHEDLLDMTEYEYATVVWHQLWEIENLARKYGFDRCAAAVAIGRMELMPELQATQPAPKRASLAPVLLAKSPISFVSYDEDRGKIVLNLPER